MYGKVSNAPMFPLKSYKSLYLENGLLKTCKYGEPIFL